MAGGPADLDGTGTGDQGPDRGQGPDRSSAAFSSFYHEHYTGMVRLAYLTLGSREQAEEVVQDAFARLHQKWPKVDHPASYARAAVMNGCRDIRRRRIRYLRREPRLAGPREAFDAPDELWDALGRLSPRQRGAVVLRFYAGMNEPEIAEALGVRGGTVKSLLHRAIEQLRKEIEP